MLARSKDTLLLPMVTVNVLGPESIACETWFGVLGGIL